MIEILKAPWPWYTSGAAIAFIMVTLLFFGKSFGVSSNLRTMCTIAGAGKTVKFFDFDWKRQKWNLLFLNKIKMRFFRISADSNNLNSLF